MLLLRLSLPLALALGLAGCSTVGESIFGSAEPPPLPGERIPINAIDRGLTAEIPPGSFRPVLGPTVSPESWPGLGGPAGNNAGHLALASGTLSQSWRQSIGSGMASDRRLVTRPILAFSILYAIDAESTVSALDAASGRILWQSSVVPEGEADDVTLPGGVAFGSGVVIAATGYATVTALNPTTGETVWTRATGAPARTAPAIADDRVFIQSVDNQILALSAKDGTPLWAYTGAAERAALLGTAAPAVEGSLLVAGLSSGELTGLRVENGRVVWSDSLAAFRRGGALSRLPTVQALPVIDQGQVVALGYDERLMLLQAGSGRRLWQRRIGGTQTPAVAQNAVFIVANDGRVLGLDRATGQIAWLQTLERFTEPETSEGPVQWFGPLLAGGVLRLLGSHGILVTLDPVSGEVLARQDLGLQPAVAPIIARDTLYVLDRDAVLSAWK